MRSVKVLATCKFTDMLGVKGIVSVLVMVVVATLVLVIVKVLVPIIVVVMVALGNVKVGWIAIVVGVMVTVCM